ncbi:MAG: DUF5691 domain-containing protein [Chitinophagaceae bacterium]
MELWNTIVNTALLGTDKRQVNAQELPQALLEATGLLQQEERDKEDAFLQTASLAFNYRQCGAEPLKKEGITISKALPEEKQYCPPQAAQALKDTLFEESIPLQTLWLQQCIAADQLIIPELIPILLSLGKQQKKLQPLLAACAGKRGEWLTRLNPEWNFSINATDEELWQTGSPEQRKSVWQQKRLADPVTARDWLQQTWPQEDANTKADLLALMNVNISAVDIPFLEGLSNEKSKKVKDAAIKLLKLIPESQIVQKYQQVLRVAFTLKKEKALLGMISKTALQLQLPVIDDQVFKSGIEKLSNNKALTDDEFIASQLISNVPPAFWETHWASTPEEIIGLLQKDKTGLKLFPAFVTATVTFKDRRWAQALMQFSEIFYLDILPLLPVEQQEHYSLRFVEKHPDDIISYAVRRDSEWSHSLTRQVFIHTAKQPYQYNRSFYSNNIHLFPVSIITELEKCTPSNEAYAASVWNNTQTIITRLLNLKKQIQGSFN